MWDIKKYIFITFYQEENIFFQFVNFVDFFIVLYIFYFFISTYFYIYILFYFYFLFCKKNSNNILLKVYTYKNRKKTRNYGKTRRIYEQIKILE